MDTIIKAVQESVDPTSVSNALYEMMLDWRTTVIEYETVDMSRTKKDRRNRKRKWLETAIGRFINRDPATTRRLLSEHFFDGRRGL